MLGPGIVLAVSGSGGVGFGGSIMFFGGSKFDSGKAISLLALGTALVTSKAFLPYCGESTALGVGLSGAVYLGMVQ